MKDKTKKIDRRMKPYWAGIVDDSRTVFSRVCLFDSKKEALDYIRKKRCTTDVLGQFKWDVMPVKDIVKR